MSKINFNYLVEQLLNESLGEDMMKLLSMPGNLTLEKCAVWASLLDKSRVGSYLKTDELIGLRPAFPIIDTLFSIFKTLQNSKIIPGINEQSAIRYAEDLKNVNNIEEFFNKLVKQNKVQKEKDEKDFIINSLKSAIENLFENYSNYRDFASVRLKQVVNLTQSLAAEEYLTLSPYEGIVKLLQEYGGYDIKLVKNILYYPGETRFTQKSNIEGPVMGTIVEISKLMLLFYREYIVDQKEKTGKPVVDSVMKALNIKDLEEFNKLLNNSAGKLSYIGEAGKAIQEDYKKFVHGKSVLTINPNVLPPVKMPVDPPKPAIKFIADFRNIAGLSQEIYQAFLSLFNNIRKGTNPSLWSVAGRNILSGLDPLANALHSITAFSGHSLYGGR